MSRLVAGRFMSRRYARHRPTSACPWDRTDPVIGTTRCATGAAAAARRRPATQTRSGILRFGQRRQLSFGCSTTVEDFLNGPLAVERPTCPTGWRGHQDSTMPTAVSSLNGNTVPKSARFGQVLRSEPMRARGTGDGKARHARPPPSIRRRIGGSESATVVEIGLDAVELRRRRRHIGVGPARGRLAWAAARPRSSASAVIRGSRVRRACDPYRGPAARVAAGRHDRRPAAVRSLHRILRRLRTRRARRRIGARRTGTSPSCPAAAAVVRRWRRWRGDRRR